MSLPLQKEALLQARLHQGHLAKRWHPRFAPFIFMKRGGRHIIDLDKTIACLKEAGKAMQEIVASGQKILFVGTKRQAKETIEETARALGQPYVTEKWLGGTLTNFNTIKKLMKKMKSIDSLVEAPTYQHLTKREKLMLARKYKKLETLLAGIATINRLPAAIFVADAHKEKLAIAEARRFDIPIFAIVDSNVSPALVSHPIPANDDAYTSIAAIMSYLKEQMAAGLKPEQQPKAAAK